MYIGNAYSFNRDRKKIRKEYNEKVDKRRAAIGLEPLYGESGKSQGVEQFVNRMAPGDAKNTAGYNADLDSARGYLNPFLQTSPNQTPNLYGDRATNYDQRLQQLLDNPDSIQNSAAYKFRMEQGLDALNRQLGARGLLNSGNRLLETTKYGQGLASQEYGDQFKRLSDIYGTNANADLGQQNANTNAWQARANTLGDFYGRASGNVNENAEIQNNNRLGWASIYDRQNPVASGYGPVLHGGMDASNLYSYDAPPERDPWQKQLGTYNVKDGTWGYTNSKTAETKRAY